MTVYADTPRRLILAGDLTAHEIANLTDFCRRLYGSGQTDVHLDMSGVVECHRAGLEGLLALTAGSTMLTITVGGARWDQFTTMLSATTTCERESLCDSVRSLLTPTGQPA